LIGLKGNRIFRRGLPLSPPSTLTRFSSSSLLPPPFPPLPIGHHFQHFVVGCKRFSIHLPNKNQTSVGVSVVLKKWVFYFGGVWFLGWTSFPAPFRGLDFQKGWVCPQKITTNQTSFLLPFWPRALGPVLLHQKKNFLTLIIFFLQNMGGGGEHPICFFPTTPLAYQCFYNLNSGFGAPLNFCFFFFGWCFFYFLLLGCVFFWVKQYLNFFLLGSPPQKFLGCWFNIFGNSQQPRGIGVPNPTLCSFGPPLGGVGGGRVVVASLGCPGFLCLAFPPTHKHCFNLVLLFWVGCGVWFWWEFCYFPLCGGDPTPPPLDGGDFSGTTQLGGPSNKPLGFGLWMGAISVVWQVFFWGGTCTFLFGGVGWFFDWDPSNCFNNRGKTWCVVYGPTVGEKKGFSAKNTTGDFFSRGHPPFPNLPGGGFFGKKQKKFWFRLGGPFVRGGKTCWVFFFVSNTQPTTGGPPFGVCCGFFPLVFLDVGCFVWGVGPTVFFGGHPLGVLLGGVPHITQGPLQLGGADFVGPPPIGQKKTSPPQASTFFFHHSRLDSVFREKNPFFHKSLCGGVKKVKFPP